MAKESFGEWLQHRRKALGLTQEQLALRIHCSMSALRKIERGVRRPSEYVVQQLAEIFDIAAHERTSFLQFARGDWQAASPHLIEAKPWQSSPSSLRSNLPVPISSFIGREKEQIEISNLILNNRLVTLTGIGGIGKTRLSIIVGNKLLADYADGVWLVELEPIADPTIVAQTVAQVLGVTHQYNLDLATTLFENLRERAIFLIFDNCEHLLNGCAELIIALLNHCPNLKVLATSREPLNIAGEALYQVSSLALPDVQQVEALDKLTANESIRLFIERARLSMMSFSVTKENASYIVQICQQLEGIPLAIELAATWVRALSCQEIAHKIGESPAFLTTSYRDIPERHRSLRAAFDRSWDLLSNEEKRVFQRLSVFRGGFNGELAKQIAGASLLVLAQLADKSLIRRNTQERYLMPELLRQYAYEKLLKSGEVTWVKKRHLKFLLKLAEAAEPKLRSTEQEIWLNRLEEEHNNMRAALQWSLQSGDKVAESGLRLAGHLWWFWFLGGYWSEGRKWLTTRVRAQTIDLQTQTLSAAGWLALFQGDYKWVTMFSEESLAEYQKMADKGSVATLLDNLGMAAEMESNYERAKMLFAQGLALRRELADTSRIANSLLNLASVYILEGDYEESKVLLEESCALYRDLEDEWNVAWCWLLLGFVAFFEDQIEQALPIFSDSLSQFRQRGDKLGIIYSLLGLAMSATFQGKLERAAILFGFEDSLAETTNFQLPLGQRAIYTQFVDAVHTQLGETGFTVAWSNGRAMSVEQALTYALSE